MKIKSLLKSPESEILKSGRVFLSPGEDVGEHVTCDREEFLVVLQGTATLKKGEEEIKLDSGETHYIAENITHNVLNVSNKELEYIYVVGLKRNLSK